MAVQGSSTTTSPDVTSLFAPADGGEDMPASDQVVTDIETEPEAGTETGDETPAGDGSGSGETTDGDTTGGEAAEPDIESLIQQFAEEHGLDLNNPNQRKIAKRLADKEAFILKQTAKLKTLEGGGTKDTDYLAEFETSLGGGETTAGEKVGDKPTDKPLETKPVESSAQGLPTLGDIGDGWKTPEQGIEELNEAWSEGNWKKVHQIETARHLRYTLGLVLPLVEQRLKPIRDQLKEFGELAPNVRQSARERQSDDAREHAISSLSKLPDFKDVMENLFAVEDGDPVTFEDQQYENTPINRIFRDHPGLLHIRMEDKDPVKALKKTFFARYLEAAKLYKRSKPDSVSPKDVKRLIEAGVNRQKTAQTQDRVRQAINAGTGSTGLGKGGADKKHYVDELNSLPGENSTRSLF